MALFTALIAPIFVDWTAWRENFEREAARIVGQPVSVAGDAKVRILPLPSITFNDLSIGRYPDGSPMMTVDAFSMNVELMPFLSGEVRIVDIRLDRPRATIRINENGTIDWTVRKELLVDPEKVQIDRLTVNDGSFSIEGLAGGRSIAGEGIAATISAQALTGPWRIDARGLVEGSPAEISVSTGRLQESGALRVKATAARLDLPYRITADGPMIVTGGVPNWSGEFELAAVSAARGGPEPLPVAATGRFEATPQAVEAPEYRLEIGPREDPYTITGQGVVRMGERILFRVEADGRQIDLDRLPTAPDSAEQAEGKSLEARVAALKAIVDRIPIPQAEGVIDFALPAIVAGDTVIREVTAIVRPQGNGWSIDRLETTFPGNTRIEASGRLGIGDDFGFAGSLLVASRQPTGFANWLSGRTNEQLRRIASAGLSAEVTLTPGQAAFENMELALDGALLTGRMQRLAPAGGRPAIVAELKGERIDLDNLIAIYALAGNSDRSALTNHDLDLTLDAGTLIAAGLEAASVDAKVKVQSGAISVDRFNAEDFYGARIESEGRLADVLDKASGSLRLKVTADDATRLASLVAGRFGPNRFLEAFAIDAELSNGVDLEVTVDARPQGDGTRGTLNVSGVLGGTQVLWRDRFEGEPARWAHARHDVTLKLVQESPALLARQLSLPVLPVDAPGPVTLDAEFSGVPIGTMNGVLAVQAPGSDFSATGSAGFPAAIDGDRPDFARPTIAFDVAAGSQDADPWFMLAGFPLPGTGEGSPLSLSLRVSGGEGKYGFSSIAGQYGGAAISGDAGFDAAREARPKLEGTLHVERVSAPFIAELAAGPGTFSGLDGQEMQFGQPLFAGFDADLALTADVLDLGAGGEGGAFSGRLVVTDGNVAAPEFSAKWLSGAIAGSMSLENREGSGVLHAQLQMSDLSAEDAVALAGFRPFLAGQADLGVTLDATGRSSEALIADLNGSGVVTLKQAQLRGLGTRGLGSILDAADAEGFEVGRESVLPLAQKGFFGGQMPLDGLQAAFSVAQGRVVVRNIQFADEGGKAEAEASLSLATGAAQASVTVTLDAGRDALAGAEPAVTVRLEGEAGAMESQIDTTALEGFLALRAFEREQRRVALLEASVLEKQRLRREVISTNARIAMREQQRLEELRRLEELQRRLEEERRKREEEAARQAAEEEARRQAEARKQAEEEARRKAEEAARKAAAAEAERKAAEEEARRQEEAERKAAEAKAEASQTVTDVPAAPAPRVVEPPPPSVRDGGADIFRNLERLFGN